MIVTQQLFQMDIPKILAALKIEPTEARQMVLKLVFSAGEEFTIDEICKEKDLQSKVKFVGIDGLAGAIGGIQMVYDGVLQATILYPPGGEEAIRTAMRILRREPYDKETILQTEQ